ncbi:amino acid ABC transporter permease [Cupriavidus sp. 8B]
MAMSALVESLPYLLQGAAVTLQLAVFTVVASFGLGTVLGAIAAVGPRFASRIITPYIYVVRGVPVLVLIFLAYFALPKLGVALPPTFAAAIALALYFAAFVTDIVRGAILAVPKLQVEAAKSIGMMPGQILRKVQLPLALRLAAPPLVTNASIAVKSTSYASIVGVWELTYASREVVERTLAAFEVFFGVMLIYFAICYPISLFASHLQHKLKFD